MLDKKQRIYNIATISALMLMTVFMFSFASKQSFWVDELDWTIGIITGKSIFNDKLFTPMFQILLEQGYNLPLYYIIIKPLYELLPYGEMFLLIPSIIFVVLGIIIMGKCGKAIGSIDIGFFAVCIAVSSSRLILQGAWELRPYSITFCFSALALLMYIRRIKTETKINILLFGISLVLLLYSHWFGSILALFYAFADLFLYFRKKISFKCIFAYFFAGILFLPWFIMMIIHQIKDLSNYWAGIPRIIEPILTVSYLLSYTVIYCFMFGIGFVVILIKCFRKNKKETPDKSTLWFILGISIVWVILPIFVYSKFINKDGSFYVQRYFFVIMPHVFLITAYGVSEVFCAVQHLSFMTVNKNEILRCVLIALFCFISFQNYQDAYSKINKISEPYREVAEHLARDKQIYSQNSLVISSSGSSWIEYYFNKRGFDIPANVARYSESSFILFIDEFKYIQPIIMPDDDILKYDYLYLFEVHSRFHVDFIDKIQENYLLVDERTEYGGGGRFGLRIYSKKD